MNSNYLKTGTLNRLFESDLLLSKNGQQMLGRVASEALCLQFQLFVYKLIQSFFLRNLKTLDITFDTKPEMLAQTFQ